MILQNAFAPWQRELFRDCWECWECGSNGSFCGGLELHHITGRDSNATINASVLCKRCHSNVGHTHNEEAKYTATTIEYLYNRSYKINEKDIQHLQDHDYLVTRRLASWASE